MAEQFCKQAADTGMPVQAAAYSDELAAESVDTAGVHSGTEAEPVVVFVCTAVMLAPADTADKTEIVAEPAAVVGLAA